MTRRAFTASAEYADWMRKLAAFAGWPYLVAQATFAAAMVAMLTWAVMPAITRVLRPWLQPAAPASEKGEMHEER